jgi:hypothetical protein
MKRDRKIFLSAFLLISITLILISCGGGGGGGSSSAPGPPLIAAEVDSFPTGSVPPGLLPSGFNSIATVFVIADSSTAAINSGASTITNAVVSMNGVPLTYNAANQDYEGNLKVDPGGSVALSVTVGGKTYTASGTQFTIYPAITTPLSGAIWPASIVNTVIWSGGTPTTNASSYGLEVLDASDPKGPLVWPPGGVVQPVPIGTTSDSIPANSLTAGNRLVIVGIGSDVAIPNAAMGSDLLLTGVNYVPITVTNATLVSIAVTPTNPSIAKGTMLQFTARGTFSDSSTQDLTTQVAWSSSDTSIATINPNLGFQGLAYGTGVGSTTITATLGSVSGFTTLTVTPAVLVSIAVSPINPAIPIGATQQFTALGTFSDSTTQDVTASVTWSSSNTGFATISNTAGSNGKATSVSSGTPTITAASGIISNSTTLMVITWSLQASGTLNDLSGIVWSGTSFVAVGANGTVLTSPDGITWTSRTSGTTSYLTGIAWSGTQFVAVGYDTTSVAGIILSSPDGVTWTVQTSGALWYLRGVVWSGTQFVAVGGYTAATILTSPDGVTWTSRTSGTTNFLSGVAWSGTTFVALGAIGTVLSSPDGVTWTLQTSGTGTYLLGVAWSGTQFVAVGGPGGIILTSPDGITWTVRLSNFTDILRGVAWSGTQFVVVGLIGGFLDSADGVTWTLQPWGSDPGLLGVAWSGTQFVAVGSGGTILTSP